MRWGGVDTVAVHEPGFCAAGTELPWPLEGGGGGGGGNAAPPCGCDPIGGEYGFGPCAGGGGGEGKEDVCRGVWGDGARLAGADGRAGGWPGALGTT